MKTLYVGGEHEVRCDGRLHYVYVADAPQSHPSRSVGVCDCPKSAFTKQHYEAIAGAVRRSKGFHQASLLGELCDMFEEDNPLFDRKEFWEACFKEESDVLS